MKEYDVTVTETLRMTVTVEADSPEDAEQKVNDKWHNGDYILDADNFVGVTFETEGLYQPVRDNKDGYSR